MIAACQHDIGMWTDLAVDYLPPSRREAVPHLDVNELSPWLEDITLMIDWLHQVRAITGDMAEKHPPLEDFSRADFAEFSLSSVLGGVSRDYLQTVKRQFPNAGFHKILMKAAGGWFVKQPLQQLPL